MGGVLSSSSSFPVTPLTHPTASPAPALAGITLRPLGLGELLDSSFALYRRLFAPLVALQVICGLPGLAATIYGDAVGGAAVGARLVALLLNLVLGTMGTAATALLIGEVYLGRSLGVREALARVTGHFWTVVLTALLVGLISVLSALPTILAFGAAAVALASSTPSTMLVGAGLSLAALVAMALPLWVFGATSLSTIGLVLERLPTARGAVSRSWRLTAGARGRIMLLLFMLFTIIGIGVLGVGGLYASFSGAAFGAPSPLLSLLQAVVAAVLGPLVYCVLTLIYYDRRVRLEGFDLELLADTLA